MREAGSTDAEIREAANGKCKFSLCSQCSGGGERQVAEIPCCAGATCDAFGSGSSSSSTPSPTGAPSDVEDDLTDKDLGTHFWDDDWGEVAAGIGANPFLNSQGVVQVPPGDEHITSMPQPGVVAVQQVTTTGTTSTEVEVEPGEEDLDLNAADASAPVEQTNSTTTTPVAHDDDDLELHAEAGPTLNTSAGIDGEEEEFQHDQEQLEEFMEEAEAAAAPNMTVDENVTEVIAAEEEVEEVEPADAESNASSVSSDDELTVAGWPADIEDPHADAEFDKVNITEEDESLAVPRSTDDDDVPMSTQFTEDEDDPEEEEHDADLEKAIDNETEVEVEEPVAVADPANEAAETVKVQVEVVRPAPKKSLKATIEVPLKE